MTNEQTKYVVGQHPINVGLPKQDERFSALDLHGNGTAVLLDVYL